MEKKHVNLAAKTLMTFAIVFVIALVGKLPANAAEAPTGVEQADDWSDAFRLKWNPVSNATGYEVQMATSKDGTYYSVSNIEMGELSGYPAADIYNLSAGKSYWVKVLAVDEQGVSSESEPVEMVTSPAAPTNIKHTGSSVNSITVSWSASSGATAYDVLYGGMTSGKAKTKHVGNKKSVTISGLDKNKEYVVAVVAGRKSSTGYVSRSGGAVKENLPVKPSKTGGVKTAYPYSASSENRINKVQVGCSRTDVADGYQYQVYTAGSKSAKLVDKTVSGITKNVQTFSHSKIKSNTFIKVRIRTYANINGRKVYGDWSDWKYNCQQTEMNKKAGYNSKRIRAAWNKVDGANRYTVYMSTKKTSGYKSVGSTTKTSLDITKFNGGKLKKGKTYYFYVVAEKKVNGKYVKGNHSLWYWTARL